MVPTATTRPPAARALVQRRRNLRPYLAPFGMHAVLGRVVGLDGQEGAGPDVQRHGVARHPAVVETVQELVGEVQAGRRRRHGAFRGGEHGLVVETVALVGRPLAGDVGRQRRLAEPGDRLVQHRAGEGEAQEDVAALPSPLHLGVEPGELAGRALRGLAEADAVADGEPLRRPGEGAPAIRALAPMQGDLDPGRRLAPDPKAGEAGGDHLGVVDDEGVAGAEQVGEIADRPVGEGLRPA